MKAVRVSEFRCGLWMTVNLPNSWHAGAIIHWPSSFVFCFVFFYKKEICLTDN